MSHLDMEMTGFVQGRQPELRREQEKRPLCEAHTRSVLAADVWPGWSLESYNILEGIFSH